MDTFYDNQTSWVVTPDAHVAVRFSSYQYSPFAGLTIKVTCDGERVAQFNIYGVTRKQMRELVTHLTCFSNDALAWIDEGGE